MAGGGEVGGVRPAMFGRGRSTHRALAERADELGLDERSLAAQAQVDPHRVADALESDLDLEATLTVGEVKRMLRVLDLDFLTVFGIPCVSCRQVDAGLAERLIELRSLPRNELIARRREQLGLSQDDLLTKVGVTAWYERNAERRWAQNRMRLWRALETGPDALDDLSLDQVRLLNRVLLLPTHLLVGVRCSTCDR